MDHFSQRIYWADLELSVIGSVLYDGSDSVVSVSSKQGLQSTFIFAFNYYLEFQIMIHKYENFTFWISSNSFSFQLVTLTKFTVIFIPTGITKRAGQKNFLTLGQTWSIAVQIQKILNLIVTSVDVLF